MGKGVVASSTEVPINFLISHPTKAVVIHIALDQRSISSFWHAIGRNPTTPKCAAYTIRGREQMTSHQVQVFGRVRRRRVFINKRGFDWLLRTLEGLLVSHSQRRGRRHTYKIEFHGIVVTGR